MALITQFISSTCTSDKKIEIILLLELGDLLAIALKMCLVILANLDQDVRDFECLGLQFDELEWVGFEGGKVLGAKSDQQHHVHVAGLFGERKRECAVLSSSE